MAIDFYKEKDDRNHNKAITVSTRDRLSEQKTGD